MSDAKPLLSIMVPTYNRRDYLSGILFFFRNLLDRNIVSRSELEIVISDNCSMDGSREWLLQQSKDLPLVVVSPPQHLPTAEENLYFGIGKTRGKYLWLLGDDDSPNPDVVLELVARIREERDDIIISNASGISFQGGFFDTRTLCTDTSELTSILQIAQRTGLMFTLAGFSTTIISGDIARASIETAYSYFKISPIYSHVFWLLDVFSDKRFHFFPQNLVCYKENASDVIDTGHWRNFAGRMDTFERYSWTIGLIRLCKRLKERVGLPTGWFAEAFDQNWNMRFRLLDVFVQAFLAQLEGQMDRRYRMRKMSIEEAREFCDFILQEDPIYIHIFASLRLYTVPSLADVKMRSIEAAVALLESQLNTNCYRRFLIGKVNGWAIYRVQKKYFATPYGTHEFRTTRQFQDIGPIEQSDFLIAKSWEEIADRCKASPKLPAKAFSRNTSGGDDQYNEPAFFADRFNEGDLIFLHRLRKIFVRIKRWLPGRFLRSL